MGLVLMFMLSLILLGPVVCLSTSSWLIYWIGMELSLMSLFPLMFNSNIFMSEAVMKYFLVQVMASIILFFGGSFVFMFLYENMYSLSLLMFGLLIKLGMFPFHYWVIPVIGSVWYMEMILILVPMKIPSFALINIVNSFSEYSQLMLLMISMLSMVVGAFLGNNCSNIRSMMGASSISHSGWVVMGSLVGGLWYYFSLYSGVLILTLLLIWSKDNLLSSLMVLSLSGLPPFLLFSMKFYVLMVMIKMGYSLIILLIPVLSALISLNFYLKSSYSFYLNSKKISKFFSSLSWMLTMNLFGGILIFFY